MAKTINYGNNKLDYKDFITNLAGNVDSYVSSHPEWSDTQKQLFKDQYNKLKTAMQESLDNNTDRFSIDEFGTITDKQGEFKNASDEDNLIDKHGNLITDTSTLSKRKKAKLQAFKAPQLMADFANQIARATVSKMNEQKQSIPTFADYWQKQHDPEHSLDDQNFWQTLDESGSYKNRIQQTLEDLTKYTNDYNLSEDQLQNIQKYRELLTSDKVGSDQWKKDLRMQAAKMGWGNWNDQFFGFKTSTTQQSNTPNPNDDQWLLNTYGEDIDKQNYELYPNARATIIAKLKKKYEQGEQSIYDEAKATQQQEEQARKDKAWQDYLKANPWYANVEHRLGKITNDNIFTSMYRLSNSGGINSSVVKTLLNSISTAVANGNKQGDFFRTSTNGGYYLNGQYKPIKTLGEALAYALPYIQQQREKAIASNDPETIAAYNKFFDQFEPVEDAYGHKIYKVKNSRNNQGYLYFYYKNGKLYSYRDTPYNEKYNQITKAQLGTVLSTKYQRQLAQKKTEAKKAAILNNPNISEEEKGKVRAQRTPNDTGFTGTDLARLGAIAADLGSIGAAYVPGYGTAASAVLGYGSTLTNAAADLIDGTDSTGNILWDATKNLGMDTLGLIPGLGTSSKVGKITKTLVKYAPRILGYLGTISTVKEMPEIIGSFKKAINSPSKLTVQDYNNMASGLKLIVTGHNSVKRKIDQHNATFQGDQIGVKLKDNNTGEVKTFIFKGDDATTIRNAKNNADIQKVIGKYNKLRNYQIEQVNKVGLFPHLRKIKSEDGKYQSPITYNSQKTQIYDVYSNGNRTWTSKEGIRGWLQPYGNNTRMFRIKENSSVASPSVSLTDNANLPVDNINLPTVINQKPWTLYSPNSGLEGSIASIQAQQAAINARRRKSIEAIDDSHAPAAAANRNQYLEREGVEQAVQEARVNQSQDSKYQKLLQEYKQAREAYKNSSNTIDATYYKDYMDVVKQQLRDLTPAYNKLRESLKSSPNGKQITFSNGTTEVVRNWQDIVKKYGLKYKKGGIIKAQVGTKTDWRTGIQAFDPSKYTTTVDTSTLHSYNNGKLGDKWVSNQAGHGTGRYTPTSGYTREQVQQIEGNKQYQDFTSKLLDENGNFTEVGKAWAKAVDNELPTDSQARFFDSKGNLRTSWSSNNKDPYGRPAQKFTNLKDYLNYMRTDNILGARHNIFVNTGKRYYYKDANGQRVYINPDEVSKYKLADTTTNEFDADKLTNWTDQEIIGLAPEASKVDALGAQTLPEEKKQFKLSNLSPTITYGIPRAIAADRINRKITDMSKTSSLLLQPMAMHRNIYSDYNAEATGYNNWAQLRNMASNAQTSDASLNAATKLEANLKGAQMYQQAMQQSDQVARQSAEAAWSQEKENAQNAWQTANANRESIHNNDISNKNREAAYYTQKYQIWDTLAQELEQEALTDYKLRQARADQFAQKDIEGYVRNQISKPEVYSKYGLSSSDIDIWNSINNGLKQASDLTAEQRQQYQRVSQAADQLSNNSLRDYYKIPQSRYYTSYRAQYQPEISITQKKEGGKLDIAFLKAAAKDADRFYKTTKDFADRTERAIERLTNIKKKKKKS